MAVSAKANTRAAAPKPGIAEGAKQAAPTPTPRRANTKLAIVGPETKQKSDSGLLHSALAALDSSRACTFLCDMDFNIFYANKKAQEVLEFMEPNLRKHDPKWQSFSAAEAVGSNLEWLFTDEPLEFRRATDPRYHPYRQNIRTGPCVCDIQVTSIQNERGELVGYAVDWERITDKLAQERRIKQLLTVLENATTNTFLCDLDWNIVYANKRSFEVLEFMEPNLHKHDAKWRSFKASEIVGQPLNWLFTDEPEEMVKAGAPRNHPYHKAIKTGPCVCEVSITGTYDDDGKQLGYAVSWERITERVAAEKRQKQLLTALEGASVSVMIADADFNVIYMNTALTQSLKNWELELQKLFGSGFSADALLRHCLNDLYKSSQRQSQANETIFPYKTLVEVGPYKINLAVNIIKSETGEVLGYCTEWNDVTERLREEEDYKAAVKGISDRMEFLRGACSTDMANAMEALVNGDMTTTIEPRTPLLDIPKQPDLAMMAETFNNLRNQTVKSVEAYNRAKEALSTLIAQTRGAADTILQASSEVAAGTDDLSQRTEEQASSLEETASSMEEMTSTVKQNADNARQANQLAFQAREVAEKGGAVVNNAVTSMEEINKASKKIADIISVIDEIAFQTNLLALNAAVEAARVGEQGRGFAVVAAEVRSLAGRSATAAKEIKALVQDSVQKVQEGSTLVNQSGATLDEIVNSVKKVADIIAEISAASQEQSAGIEQVNKAIMQMDQITQQNAALVEETAAASRSMNQQATDLQSVVGKFQLEPTYLLEIQQRQAQQQATQSAAARAAARPQRPAPIAARPTRAKPFMAEADSEFEEF